MSERRLFLRFLLFSPFVAREFLRPAHARQSTIAAPETQTFADFEGGTWEGWTIEGDAFGAKPATNALFPGKISGFGGQRFVCTIHPRRGNAAMGRAVSREFIIENPFITFKIGGGKFPDQACLNLIVDGKVVRTETGGGTPDLSDASWDVSNLVGKTARFEIVDSSVSTNRGYILVDDIRFPVASSSGFGAPDEWNQWRGPERNGVCKNSPPLLDRWDKDGPLRLWKSTVDERPDNGAGCPVFSGGRVYLFLQPRDMKADGVQWLDRVVCLNATDGALLWERSFPSTRPSYAASSTPCVVDGRLFVVGDSVAYALDAKDGRTLWTFKTPTKEVFASFLVVDGVAILNAGQLFGLDPATGRVIWALRPPRGTYAHTTRAASPAVWQNRGNSYIIVHIGDILCIQPRTGSVIWRQTGVGQNDGNSPTIVGNKMTLGWCGTTTEAKLRTFELSLQGARQIWSVDALDAHSCPIIVGDYVYAIGGWKGGRKTPCYMRCINLQTGEKAWEETIRYQENSSPVAADGKIFQFMDQGRKIVMISATPDGYKVTGEIVAPRASRWVGSSSFAIAGGKLYARPTQETVVCYDLTRNA